MISDTDNAYMYTVELIGARKSDEWKSAGNFSSCFNENAKLKFDAYLNEMRLAEKLENCKVTPYPFAI